MQTDKHAVLHLQHTHSKELTFCYFYIKVVTKKCSIIHWGSNPSVPTQLDGLKRAYTGSSRIEGPTHHSHTFMKCADRAPASASQVFCQIVSWKCPFLQFKSSQNMHTNSSSKAVKVHCSNYGECTLGQHLQSPVRT